MKVPISDYDVIDLLAPTLPAYSRRGTSGAVRWLVWCCHCQVWHYHRAGDGHREAHCEVQTPYSKTATIWRTGADGRTTSLVIRSVTPNF
jgi:hypothetical protein